MAHPCLTNEKASFIQQVRDSGRGTKSSVAIYDHHAHEYNAFYNTQRWAGPEAVSNRAVKLLRTFPESQRNVLDFGCGTGLTGIQLRQRKVTSVDGLDPSSGMLAMVPEGVYGKTFSNIDDIVSKYALIVSTAVIGTHVGPEKVSELVQSHLKPRGCMIFTLKESFYVSPEFSTMFKLLKDQGYEVSRTEGSNLHTDDAANVHTIVTIKDKRIAPRQTIILWSTPRSMSTAIERFFSGHTDITSIMHDIFSAAEFGLTDPEIQGGEFDGETKTTYEQVVKYVHDAVYSGEKGIIFIKTIARCSQNVRNDREYWLQPHFQHAFLVEEPKWVIPSVYARLDEGVRFEPFLVSYESLLMVVDALGRNKPYIIQAKNVRNNPEKVIKALVSECFGLESTGISFTWEAGCSPQWLRCSAGSDKSSRVGTDGFKEYHDTVSNSTGFLSTRKIYEQNTTNNKLLADLELSVLPYYDHILSQVAN